MEIAAEVTKEYARQIIKAANENEDDYLVVELLHEYAARAYRQGREHLAATILKLV